MAADEIVDVSRTDVKRRRQFAARVGLPLLGVLLVILSILGISLYSYQANRAGALALSRALLNGLQLRIGREVAGYLSPATQAALIARDMVARHAVPAGRATIESFAASMLNQVPHLEGFYVANGRGDFIMVRRDPRGGTDTKLILNKPDGREVSSLHLNDRGEPLDRTLQPGDNFDPRTRTWYQGAMKTDGVYWSPPYVFYTTHAPGITGAIRLTQAGQPDRVFGIDITLEALSSFLASLKVGQTGRAAIVDRDGNVIAAPELAQVAAGRDVQAIHETIAALHDPALAAAYDHERIEGHGSRIVTVGNRRFVTVASLLPAAGQDWLLLIAAPESDFTAFAANNSRQNLLLSLITIGLASLLGVQWLRQSRRADRTARLLTLQREIAAREARALSALASQPGLFDQNQPAPALTESLAELSEARRASIWRLTGGGRILHCEDSFDPQQDGHVEGLELSRSELPHLFEALDSGAPLEVADAEADARTAELHRLVMSPFGSRTAALLPVRGPDGPVGAVLLEDAREPARVRNFARAVASIAAMRMATQTDVARSGAEPDRFHAPTPEPAIQGAAAFSSMLSPDGRTLFDLAATVFPSVAAMIIRFDDAISLGRPDQDGVTTLVDRIARAMQEVSSQYALPYMKLAGHNLVAAAGCTGQPDPTAAERLADAALAAREACLSLLMQAGLEPVFRIGMDYGPALGGALGEEPRLFNLWGDVVRTAELLAQSAADSGSIQVSESAYAQLRQRFLFRSRGVFYVPRIGTARTFILAGRR